MNDTTGDTNADQSGATTMGEVKTLWHDVEEFFAHLFQHVVSQDANKLRVLSTFKASTHEIMGTVPPAPATAVTPTPVPAIAANTNSVAEPTQ